MKLHIDTLLVKISDAAKATRTAKTKLAHQAGLHPNTLASLGRPGWTPSIGTIQALERILFHKPDHKIGPPAEPAPGS